MILSKLLKEATQKHQAIGHFNISNLEMFRGILEGAKLIYGEIPEVCHGIMIGTSEGEAKFIGRRQAIALARAFEDEYNIPIFLNADHHKSVTTAKEAIDAGYDSVHIDLSKESYEKNLSGTKEIVEYAKSKNPAISVEGELGYLPTDSSRIYKEEVKIDPASLTKPQEAAEFVSETGIDRFAAAVGNLHGIAANEPKLDLERVIALRASLPDYVALVLHGGSGIPQNQIKEAIQNGMNNVHISTELRAVFMGTLRVSMAEHSEELAPYKIYPPAVEVVQKLVEEKIRLFAS